MPSSLLSNLVISRAYQREIKSKDRSRSSTDLKSLKTIKVNPTISRVCKVILDSTPKACLTLWTSKLLIKILSRIPFSLINNIIFKMLYPITILILKLKIDYKF